MKAFRELVGEAIGEASVCWSEPPRGVFDSTRACAIVDSICVAAEQLPANEIGHQQTFAAEVERLRAALLGVMPALNDGPIVRAMGGQINAACDALGVPRVVDSYGVRLNEQWPGES